MDNQFAINSLQLLLENKTQEVEVLKFALNVLKNGYASDVAIIEAARASIQMVADKRIEEFKASLK
ncbi:MAG: hypothetical protein WC243_03855 [Patescibacteria group bacterium]|jgi:hypothetical protein